MHLSSDSLIESDSLFSSSKFLECNDKDDEDVIGGKLHIKKEQKESENIVTHSIWFVKFQTLIISIN